MAGLRRNAMILLLLALAMAVGAVVRLHGLPGESPWCDEALILAALDAPTLPTFLQKAFAIDPMTRMIPVYHVVTYGWSRMLGSDPLSLRLLSVLLGLLCIPLLYTITRRFFGQATGVLAAFFLALSQSHAYQSQEIRFYALMSFLSLLSMCALQRGLDTGKARWWTVSFLANALLLWAHAFSPLFFVVQGVWLLACAWRRKRLLAMWVAVHAGLGALFLIWLKSLHFEIGKESHAYHLAGVGWRLLANTFVVLAGGRPTTQNPASYMPGGISLDGALAVMLVAALAVLAWRVFHTRLETDRSSRGALLFALWCLLPFVMLYGLSRCWTHVFYYRYVIYSLAPVYGLFAAGLLRLPGRRTRILAVAAVLLAFVWQSALIPKPIRADYQRAAQLMEEGPDEGKVVFALKAFNGQAVRFNTHLPERQIRVHHGFDELCAEVVTVVGEGSDTWAVFHHWARLDDFKARMGDAGITPKEHILGGMPPLHVYHLLENGAPGSGTYATGATGGLSASAQAVEKNGQNP